MDSTPSSSMASSSFIPPRRPVLSACLLAALLLLSSPTPVSSANPSLVPSPTSPPTSRPTGTAQLGSIPIQHAFGELDWPNNPEGSASSREALVDPPPHLSGVRRQLGQTQSRRLKRQDAQSESPKATATVAEGQQDGQATASASEVVVAEVPSSVATDGLVASTAAEASPTSSVGPQSTSTPMGKVAPPVPTVKSPIRNPFPQPFDLTLNLNLSSGCLDYFSFFLSSQPFQACRPFSFLQSSSSAFSSLASADNLTAITDVVQATLDVGDAGECETVMVGMGTTFSQRCKADLANGVPIAKEALTGFETYGLMHRASALVSPTSGAYCFVEALAMESPADLFAWNLYTGASLPNGTNPSCSLCTKSLLDVYATDASNSTLALSKSYDAAVKMSNAKCGNEWAKTVLVVQSSSGRPSLPMQPSLAIFGPLLLLAVLSIPSLVY